MQLVELYRSLAPYVRDSATNRTRDIVPNAIMWSRQTDKYGNLAQWWTSSTTDTYLKKAQCFIDQYNSYRVPELDSLVRREVKMNGVITQGENMADLGGLRQAYHAYKTLVRETGAEPRL
ncbi:unnamed protein product, partial [Timema podura]|nr:unnamed protein product [Timema podura]